MWRWLKMAYLWELWGSLDTHFLMHWNVLVAWQKGHVAYSLHQIFLSLIGQLVYPSPQMKWGTQILSLGELTSTEAVRSDRCSLCWPWELLYNWKSLTPAGILKGRRAGHHRALDSFVWNCVDLGKRSTRCPFPSALTSLWDSQTQCKESSLQ